MNKIFVKSLGALLLASCVSMPLLADKEYLEVESFDAIDIGTGMEAKVTCGSSNTVTIYANKKVLDKVEVKIKGGILEIERHTSASNILNNIFGSDDKVDKSIKIVIEMKGSLSSIDGSTGSIIKVNACAIDASSLKIDGGTGSNINISGHTATLDLDLSTGASFNHSGEKFTVELAKVDLSTGASASLCGAKTITGDASTGASIKASDTAMTDDVDLSLGAEVNKTCR